MVINSTNLNTLPTVLFFQRPPHIHIYIVYVYMSVHRQLVSLNTEVSGKIYYQPDDADDFDEEDPDDDLDI